jgi:lipoyl(octanoyl) transferase
MKLFKCLAAYHDVVPRSSAMNMAMDEALLEAARIPSIRFYRWNSPALSFGYFGNFAEVAEFAAARDLVRRWTGGGIVFHGGDLTYSITIPSDDAGFSESPMSIYEKTHGAIQRALQSSGEMAELASSTSPRISDSCFANAVRSDVILNGQKVAGAAQRRTRRGLLQQGSIQNVEVGNGLAKRFAQELGAVLDERKFDTALIRRAHEIAERKYGTTEWLRRR